MDALALPGHSTAPKEASHWEMLPKSDHSPGPNLCFSASCPGRPSSFLKPCGLQAVRVPVPTLDSACAHLTSFTPSPTETDLLGEEVTQPLHKPKSIDHPSYIHSPLIHWNKARRWTFRASDEPCGLRPGVSGPKAGGPDLSLEMDLGMRLPARAHQRCSSGWSPFNGPATGIFFPVEFLVNFLEVPTADRTLTASVCVATGPLAKGYVILTMLLKRLVCSLTSVSLKETLGQLGAGLSSLSPNTSSPLPLYLLHTEPLHRQKEPCPAPVS